MNGKESLPKKPKQKVITKFRTNADTAEKYLELGKKRERERIIKLLKEEIAKQEQAASTLDETGVLIGLKRAELYIKELKWT